MIIIIIIIIICNPHISLKLSQLCNPQIYHKLFQLSQLTLALSLSLSLSLSRLLFSWTVFDSSLSRLAFSHKGKLFFFKFLFRGFLLSWINNYVLKIVILLGNFLLIVILWGNNMLFVGGFRI